MNNTRILRIQVADEYRVNTRAKPGNHPNRNFENLTGDNEERADVGILSDIAPAADVCDDHRWGEKTFGKWKSSKR